MRSKRLKFGEGFRVAFEVRKAQAAEMVIAPGDSEGGPDNRHRGADQWLFVVEGRGLAVVETEGRKRRVTLEPGRLLVIDFAQHERAELKEQDAHLRLGFADDAMRGWFAAAGLKLEKIERLGGGELTVILWRGVKSVAANRERAAA